MLRSLIHRAGRAYISHRTASEASAQKFARTNERPVEYAYALKWLNRLSACRVLDVGTGKTAWPALLRNCGFVVSAIDNVYEYWPKGMINRHWHVVNDDITTTPNGEYEPFDAVTCISVIEHIPDLSAAMRGLHARTRPGGHLILTTPFGPRGHQNVYGLPGSASSRNSYMCRQHSPDDLKQWLAVGFTQVDVEYWRVFSSAFWSVGSRIHPLERQAAPAHLGCFLLRRD